MNMINVDFNDLKRINQDVVGWLKVNGTNIVYPFVQANDNKYYLTHSFNKLYNAAGWVFWIIETTILIIKIQLYMLMEELIKQCLEH